MNTGKIVKLIIVSIFNFLLNFHYLHLRKDRLGQIYQVEPAGQYQIFRETVNRKKFEGKSVVLVVGFRLKLIGVNPFFHWLFQRICILTTPFWAGFKGFKVKLWMVNPENKNYLGIYQWQSEQNTQDYINFLTPILHFFSKKNSVWSKIYLDTKLDDYLISRRNAGVSPT